MNGTEQRKHRTAVAEVAKETTEALEALIERLENHDGKLDEADRNVAWLRGAIDEEIAERVRLFDEQRRYVAGADSDIIRAHNLFVQRGFWSRLNWLLTGR